MKRNSLKKTVKPGSLERRVRAHAGDCTIYAALINGTPLDGICTCGYGWECVRHGDWDKIFSAEWLEANKRPNAPGERPGETTKKETNAN